MCDFRGSMHTQTKMRKIFQSKIFEILKKKMSDELGEMAVHSFSFDRVFNPTASQLEVYDVTAKPVVYSVLDGFNGTVFAYGQTSSGKTYTMAGPDIDDEILKGITPRMVSEIFNSISDSPDHIEWRIKVSVVEIYMERIRDLLDITKTN